MDDLWTRRDVMKGLGAAAMAAGAAGLWAPGRVSAQEQAPSRAGIVGETELPPLPYPYAALEPYIDRQTLQIHHDKHHAGYVKGFNSALDSLAQARAEGNFSLIKHLSRELAFHGAGHVLHSLYWASMAPEGKGGEPQGDLLKAIEENFGSLDAFKGQFIKATSTVEASGWGILAHEPYRGHLLVLQAEKHQDLTVWGAIPLVVCDVWEHAYYLKYQNNRGEYVKNFFKIIDWRGAARRYEQVKGLAMYR